MAEFFNGFLSLVDTILMRKYPL